MGGRGAGGGLGGTGGEQRGEERSGGGSSRGARNLRDDRSTLHCSLVHRVLRLELLRYCAPALDGAPRELVTAASRGGPEDWWMGRMDLCARAYSGTPRDRAPGNANWSTRRGGGARLHSAGQRAVARG